MNNEYRSNYLIRSCAVSKPESHRCNSNGARRWARYLPAASLCDATPAQSSRTNHHCRYHSAVVLRHKNDTESLHKRARHEGTTVGVWDNIQRPVSCVSLCDPERLATVTGGRGGRFRRATAAAASAAPSFARRAAVGAAAASVLAPPALPQRRRQHVSLFCLAVHWHVGMQFGS